MLLSLVNLDDETRQLMIEEIEMDITNRQLYLSARLSDIGQLDYPVLLKQAAKSYDDEWLASQLQRNDRLNATEQRRIKSGYMMAKIPVNAHITIAEGEFNKFYIRGLCRRAMNEGISSLIIYRAKEVMNPRPESQTKIGTTIDARALLHDLRANSGDDRASGLLGAPNSGLSVKLP